jgi:hypothetical protein
MQHVSLTDRELATVLAALRHWQEDQKDFDPPLDQDPAPWLGMYFAEHEPLTSRQVDALCERLNTSASEPGDNPYVAMCRRVAETIANWVDCSDLLESLAVFRELGADARKLVETAPQPVDVTGMPGSDKSGATDSPYLDMCRRVVVLASNWADGTQPAHVAVRVFHDLGEQARLLLETAQEPVHDNRYVLYDFDADELLSKRVYDCYDDAADEAELLNDVLIVRVPIASRDIDEGSEDGSPEESCNSESS